MHTHTHCQPAGTCTSSYHRKYILCLILDHSLILWDVRPEYKRENYPLPPNTYYWRPFTSCKGGGIPVGDFEWDESIIDEDNIPRGTHLDDILVVHVDDILVTDLLVLLIDGQLDDVTDFQVNLSRTTLEWRYGSMDIQTPVCKWTKTVKWWRLYLTQFYKRCMCSVWNIQFTWWCLLKNYV